MNNIVQNISLANLSLAFIPVLVVIAIIWRWNMGYKTTIYAIFRMLVQLLLIGYVLTYIFETNSNYIVITILIIMLSSSQLDIIKDNLLASKNTIIERYLLNSFRWSHSSSLDDSRCLVIKTLVFT